MRARKDGVALCPTACCNNGLVLKFGVFYIMP